MDFPMVVDIFSVVAVVSGLLFAGLELRHFRKSRERESALELISTFQSPEFIRGFRSVTKLPYGQSKEQIESLLGEQMDALYFYLLSLEGLGFLVHSGEISLGMVEGFMSGAVMVAWSRLRQYIVDERKAVGRATFGEWLQWLAERIEKNESLGAHVPAHIAHQDWTPA